MQTNAFIKEMLNEYVMILGVSESKGHNALKSVFFYCLQHLSLRLFSSTTRLDNCQLFGFL